MSKSQEMVQHWRQRRGLYGVIYLHAPGLQSRELRKQDHQVVSSLNLSIISMGSTSDPSVFLQV